MPDWDEVAGEYTGSVLGFPEWGAIRGGQTRDAFEQAVGERLSKCNPPQTHFVVEWSHERQAHHRRPDIAA